ncbi:MAG: hypothetical protein KDD50_13870, partial [Bdellovibrionales bacterium]|nr:hypothetical protein [Bdellovibrionales bacterium]
MAYSVNRLIFKYGWNEWLCKTNFSFLMGASHPHEIMQRAWALNYSSICINDYDGVYGLARSFLDLQRLKQENFSSENKKSLR